jgi:aspartyl-tRNA(Asn)/glutamyl-tRNA(Gln) amidotransferase subunit A
MAASDEQVWEAINDSEARTAISVESLVTALFERIERWQPEIRAFISLTPTLAHADAERADEARKAGTPLPLDGLPVGIKDCIDVATVPTTVGSSFFGAAPASDDSEVVRRLREAGAVIVGKTNMHEIIFGGTTDNPFYGTCRNPWDVSRIPGGSSGGSGAALGAGLCIGALGSDTGGSIRIPAALNGTAGLRPTYGLVSTRGVFPLSRTFDAVGPMARSVRDIASMFDVIAGYDFEDPRAVRPDKTPITERSDRAAVRTVRLGVPVDFFFDGLDPDVERLTRAAIETLSDLTAGVTELVIPEASRASERSNPIIWAEAFAVHRQRYLEHPEGFGSDTRRRLEMGANVTGAEFAEAIQGMYEWQRSIENVFRSVDVIATPTTTRPAPKIEDVETVSITADLVRLNHQWSLAHTPALIVPCGFTSDGLPVGLQLTAARWNDHLLLRLGSAFQEATDWHLRRPAELADSLSHTLGGTAAMGTAGATNTNS